MGLFSHVGKREPGMQSLECFLFKPRDLFACSAIGPSPCVVASSVLLDLLVVAPTDVAAHGHSYRGTDTVRGI